MSNKDGLGNQLRQMKTQESKMLQKNQQMSKRVETERIQKLWEIQNMIQGKKYTFDASTGTVLIQKAVSIDKLPETNLKLPF